MAALCTRCDERGDYTLATTERHGEPCCENCAQSQDERAYERMVEDFHGGSGPQSDRERFDVDSMNRVRR